MSSQTKFNSLKGNIYPTPQIARNRVGILNGLFVAGLVTGANWFIQTRLAAADKERQNQVIKRVHENKAIQVQDLMDYSKLSQYEGARIKVTGQLQSGRFVVKRKRGEQEGYVVLAPFIVNQQQTNDRRGKKLNTKYMLNLGWVPKQSKHKIRNTINPDILKYDELPEELADLQDPPTRTTIQAYVRKGQCQDVLRGHVGWQKDHLWKYIDLHHLQRVFNTNNASFRHLYLQRIGTQGEQSFPFPTSSDILINELKQQQKYIDKKRDVYSIGGGIMSFLTAFILASV